MYTFYLSVMFRKTRVWQKFSSQSDDIQNVSIKKFLIKNILI
jgi:hypothetical protein